MVKGRALELVRVTETPSLTFPGRARKYGSGLQVRVLRQQLADDQKLGCGLGSFADLVNLG